MQTSKKTSDSLFVIFNICAGRFVSIFLTKCIELLVADFGFWPFQPVDRNSSTKAFKPAGISLRLG
jgi:hypothetical protein